MNEPINLKAERLNRGLSLRAAAKQMGIGMDVLLRAEDGSMPRPNHAKAIADEYGYRVTDVWPLEEVA